MGQTDTVCPHCRYDFPPDELGKVGPRRDGTSPSRRGLKAVLLLVLVALVAALFYLARDFRNGLHALPN